MMQAQHLLPDMAAGLAVTQSSEDLNLISDPSCAGVIWNRPPLPAFHSWIDALAPEHLPAERVILRPKAVRDVVSAACEMAQTPDGTERTRLIEDIATLANIFAGLMKAPFLRLRLDRVSTNACRRFHMDAITARLICTYRGAGTQYGIATDGADPSRVFSVQQGAPIVLRGSLWPEHPASGLLHRSPPIEGAGETRLVLVLDPVFDPEDET